MKVNLIFTWLSTGKGGAENSLRILASEFAKIPNFEVSILIWNYNRVNLNLDNDVFFKYVECNSFSEYQFNFCRLLKISTGRKIIISNHRTFPIDIRLSKSHNCLCIIIFRALIKSDKKLRIINYQNPSFLIPKTGLELDWLTIKKADAIIGVSNTCVESVKSFIPTYKRFYSIFNPIDIFSLTSIYNNFNTETINFLIVSRLVEWKQIMLGLLSFKQILIHYPNAKLNIIGDGPLGRDFESFIIENDLTSSIRLYGWQDNVKSWYERSHCLIMTSPMEAFGRVTAEAQANGVIVVAPSTGASAELIKNNKTGLLFKPNSVESCTDVLNDFINLPRKEKLNLSQYSFEFASDNYKSDVVHRKYLEVFKSLI